MTTNKIFRILFLLFLFGLLSCHVNAAKTEKFHGQLNVDGSPNDYDNYYDTSGGDIYFKLTSMPCGVTMFWIRLFTVPNMKSNYYAQRNFTVGDLNRVKVIGNDFIAGTTHRFRLQAWNSNRDKINCDNSFFDGEITYVPYIEPPNCKRKTIIAIVVPIVTAIIGSLGGVGGTLISQRRGRKKSTINDKSTT